jgi:hypothetical protein
LFQWDLVAHRRGHFEEAAGHRPALSVVMLRRQCWLFAGGASLFAIAAAPGCATIAGAGAANVLCFVGSWFFTSAALIQLLMSRPSTSWPWETFSVRAAFFSAATQFAGTLRFNVSTGAAVWAHRIPARRHFVWWPDLTGSVAFLISGALGVLAITVTVGFFQPNSREWLAAWINMIGSIAFGASAIGAYIKRTGVTEDALLSNEGTFVGALCFLTAALLVLPTRPVPARVPT